MQAIGWARDPIHAAGGHRRYLAQQRAAAHERQIEILRIIHNGGHDLLSRGSQAVLARRLGVSHTTIARDIRTLFAPVMERSDGCSLCGARPITEDGIDAVADGGGRLIR